MTRRFFAMLALLAAGFASVLLIAPAQAAAAPAAPPVAAATCSGTGCDNKDPVNTGCASSGSSVASKDTAKGRFHLYYSSVCKTNWIRVGNYAGGSGRPDNKLQLTVWDAPRNKYVDFFASSSAGVHYGNMVYSPGNNCSWGMADWNLGGWDVQLKSSSC